jgi:hypothetical protein
MEEADHSTAEHGKVPSQRHEGGAATYNTPVPTIFIGRQKIADAQQRSVEKGGKKEGDTRKWTGFPMVALHSTLSLEKKKKEVTTTQYTTFQDCKERGGMWRAFQLHTTQP